MSQVVRTTPANAQAAAGSVPRMPTGARGFATFEPTPIDELGPKVGISYEETEYLFQDFGNDTSGGGQKRPPLGISALLRTSSDAFVSFMELLGGSSESHAAPAGTRVSAFGFTLSNAIRAYEASARAVSDNSAPRGGVFSFQL